MFVVAISAVFFRSVYYSFLSRGYSYVVLFFIIALYAAYNIIYKGNRKKDWMFFSISGILGCYAMPSFVYPFVTVNIFILIYNYKHILKQAVYNLITGIAVLVLYTPIFLTSGFKAISGNQFVTPTLSRMETLGELPAFFYRTIGDLSGIPPFIVIGFMAVALLIATKNKDKKSLSLWGIFVITPFVLLFLHNVIPFYRTFIYYCFIIVFLTGISLSAYIDRLKKAWLISALLAIQVAGVIHFKLDIAEAESFNTYANDVTGKILEHGKTYKTSYIHILFNAKAYGYDMNSFEVIEGPFIPFANADTIDNVNYIVISRIYDTTKLKKPFYSNKDYNVYKNELPD